MGSANSGHEYGGGSGWEINRLKSHKFNIPEQPLLLRDKYVSRPFAELQRGDRKLLQLLSKLAN